MLSPKNSETQGNLFLPPNKGYTAHLGVHYMSPAAGGCGRTGGPAPSEPQLLVEELARPQESRAPLDSLL